MVWYEDILKDFEGKVNEIANFTGFGVSPEQMKVSNLKCSKCLNTQ